jgi:hypothetical protein
MADQEPRRGKPGFNRGLIVAGIAVAVVLMFLFGGRGSDPAPSDQVSRPATVTTAAPRLYPNIERETDCGVLQAIFDNAEAAGQGARDRGDLALAREHTEGMRRADARMSAVGCYG